MITPSFGLTATERVLPKLALDFITATLDPRVTFTRSGNTATYTNPSGVITAINANLPRFDYNPTTLVCQGLLIEEARTNLLLNSLIDGTSLTTQSVTVAATAYTLSFYGTGSIDLSGTHTATVTGTGAYPSRKTYTFTPTAGTLTLTVTGTVQYAQLEAGSFATSFIPTSVATATRNADIATMTGTNFSDWYNQTEGSFVWQGIVNPTTDTGLVFYMIDVTDNTINNSIKMLRRDTSTADRTARAQINYNGTAAEGLISSVNGVFTGGVSHKFSLSYKINNMDMAFDGLFVGSDDIVNIPTVNKLNLGSEYSGLGSLNGYFQKLMYYPQSLTNAELTAFSK